MHPAAPRVTVGVPVYNGAKFLAQTLDSILAQSFVDFEIVICDNGSTDETAEICKAYERRDPRVRVWRSPTNMGPAANYNKCVELARGEFFKWAAADDILAPRFLELCVAALDAEPSVVNAYPRTKRINERGEVFGEYQVELDLNHPVTAVRYWRYLMCSHKKHHAAELWGVMRKSMLHQWSPINGAYPSTDRVVTSKMILSGRLRRVEEYLFFDREHSGRSEQQFDKSKIRNGSRLARYAGCGPTPPYQWWDSSKTGKIVFPEWRWVFEYFRGIFQVKLTPVQRISCFAVASCLAIKFIPRLGRDLAIASELFAYRVAHKRASDAAPMPAAEAPDPA